MKPSRTYGKYALLTQSILDQITANDLLEVIAEQLSTKAVRIVYKKPELMYANSEEPIGSLGIKIRVDEIEEEYKQAINEQRRFRSEF